MIDRFHSGNFLQRNDRILFVKKKHFALRRTNEIEQTE